MGLVHKSFAAEQTDEQLVIQSEETDFRPLQLQRHVSEHLLKGHGRENI